MTVTADQLDIILALQLTVAWAGEAESVPPRLGWWRTGLIDPDGGGDVLARLLPRTHAWAALEAVREAAIRTDASARARTPDAHAIRTLFFLGFDLDEKLAERLRHHKMSEIQPDVALPLPTKLGLEFSREVLAVALRPAQDMGAHTVIPGGRQMRGAMPDSPVMLAQHLAAGLVPFPENTTYPMPFFRVG